MAQPRVLLGGALLVRLSLGRCDLWNTRTWSLDRSFALTRWPGPMVTSPDETILAYGGAGVVRRFDLATGAELGPEDGHRAPVHRVVVSGDGTRVATCGAEVRWWSLPDGAPIAGGFGDIGSSVAPAPDGRRVAVPGEDALEIREVSTGRTLARETVERAGTLSFSEEGGVLVLTREDSRSEVRDPETAALRGTVMHPSSGVAVCADGERLWVTSLQGPYCVSARGSRRTDAGW